MMNKKAEHFAFGVSFLAVLASFMLIVAPTLVAAPPFFPPFPDITPPVDILTPDCHDDFNGNCKAECAGDETQIGLSASNLRCVNPTSKCCKKKNTCENLGLAFPCFSDKDCGDGSCIKIGNDNANRCCLEEQITICFHPGKPEQKTITFAASAFRKFVEKELDYKFGPCTLATPTPTVTPTSTPTNTPTVVPTNTPAPTSTPTTAPTSTPVPTSTPTIVPTSTAVPTSTPTTSPTSTPVPTSTPTTSPTSTPVPTGSPSPSPSVTP